MEQWSVRTLPYRSVRPVNGSESLRRSLGLRQVLSASREAGASRHPGAYCCAMARGARCFVGAVAVLLASMCASCTERSCTTIGGIDGISVRLDVATAKSLADGRIQLCIDRACSAQQVAPTGTAMVQTCDGQGRCADSTTPQVDNAQLFFPIGDPADPTSTSRPHPRRRVVAVAVQSFDRTGKAFIAGTAEVRLQDTYYNGPDCGVTSAVGNIVLTTAGVSVTQ